MDKRPTVSLSDLQKLQEQESKPQPLTPDEVRDYAVASLVVVRGLSRGDQLKVLRKMRRLLDA